MLPSTTYSKPTQAHSSQRSQQSSSSHRPSSSKPVIANFDTRHLTIGCGVAIFHIASERVVVCYHSRDKYWFLPKGRRDAGEESGRAAEREGFEESGYRNRLLPLPIRHHQPRPHAPDPAHPPSPYVVEPVWTQLMPQTPAHQYMLFWYIGETLPPELEEQLNAAATSTNSPGDAEAAPGGVEPFYTPPPSYPAGLTLRGRLAMEPEGYEPPRHEGTGVDEEEALYESSLLPVAVAMEKLKGSVMADVVRAGWEGIQLRLQMEEAMLGGSE